MEAWGCEAACCCVGPKVVQKTLTILVLRGAVREEWCQQKNGFC